MSDESSEQLSAADTSKQDMEAQSADKEQSDADKTEDKGNDDSSAMDDQDDGENGDADSASSEEEELPAGLLEKPVLIEDGKKRERKKVERITFETTKPSSGLQIKEGKGRSLGDIPFIEYKLNRMKAEDCKPLHRVLYRRGCANNDTKRNIRQFSGFPFSKDDKEYEKRLELLKSKKFSLVIIRKMMEILDIPRNGMKNDLITRLMEWLEKPTDSNRKIPAPKRKRSSTGGKKKAGKKTKKKTEETVADSDDEVADSDDDNKDDDKDDDDDDDDKADSSDEEEEEVKTPPKKKVKKTPAKEKKPKTPKATNKKKVTPKKKKEVVEEDEDDLSSSDDEPLVAKKSKGPPTNDELKDVVKKMLDNANLEQVTMKTVLKNVFAKYPDYDLLDRKDFIKNTVKQIIS